MADESLAKATSMLRELGIPIDDACRGVIHLTDTLSKREYVMLKIALDLIQPIAGRLTICFPDDELDKPDVDYSRIIADDEPTIAEAWAALEQFRAGRG